MTQPERDSLAGAALGLATKIEANDQAGVKAVTIADYQKDFGGMSGVIGGTAPRLTGTTPEVTDVYELDASTLQAVNGANPDATFFCTLNQSQAETEFAIPQLPPGKYGFAIVRMNGGNPWQLSFLLRQERGVWLLAGLYPKALTAGGHDGLWYWKQARTLGAAKENWNQWLYLQEAQVLLLPANFVSSTHAEKLRDELAGAVPPAVSGGLSADAPLVVKGKDGTEFRFTAVTVESAPTVGAGAAQVDVAAHIKVDAPGDAATARKRNLDAAAALVAAHPELRKAFHGVLVVAEAPGMSGYATEMAMAEIP
jgi:predicted secreted protein